MDKDNLYLNHILDAAATVEVYIVGVSFDEFRLDEMRQDAVIRQIQIIGEAVKRLSPEFISKHTAIPWTDIAGMRNKLVHDYFAVDLSIVYEVAVTEVPKVREWLEKL